VSPTVIERSFKQIQPLEGDVVIETGNMDEEATANAMLAAMKK